MPCKQCQIELPANRPVFCSKECANAFGNSKHQNYQSQRERGYERKAKLVELLGGCCSHCGYDRNFATLQFHHVDTSKKRFTIDLRKCANAKWADLLEESKNCILLCANCHNELHNPHLTI